MHIVKLGKRFVCHVKIICRLLSNKFSPFRHRVKFSFSVQNTVWTVMFSLQLLSSAQRMQILNLSLLLIWFSRLGPSYAYHLCLPYVHDPECKRPEVIKIIINNNKERLTSKDILVRKCDCTGFSLKENKSPI